MESQQVQLDHEVAAQRATDKSFFAANPKRRLHVRKECPTELARYAQGKGYSSVPEHLARSVFIVHRLQNGDCVRNPIQLGSLSAYVNEFDNDEGTLKVLWKLMKQRGASFDDFAQLMMGAHRVRMSAGLVGASI